VGGRHPDDEGAALPLDGGVPAAVGGGRCGRRRRAPAGGGGGEQGDDGQEGATGHGQGAHGVPPGGVGGVGSRCRRRGAGGVVGRWCGQTAAARAVSWTQATWWSPPTSTSA